METRQLTADQAMIVKNAIELHKVRMAISRWINHGQVGPKWSSNLKTAKAFVKADQEAGYAIMRLEGEFDRRGGRGMPGFSGDDIEKFWMVQP